MSFLAQRRSSFSVCVCVCVYHYSVILLPQLCFFDWLIDWAHRTCSADVPTAADLVNSSDDALSERVLKNPRHALHQLLLQRSATGHNLRQGLYDRVLLPKQGPYLTLPCHTGKTFYRLALSLPLTGPVRIPELTVRLQYKVPKCSTHLGPYQNVEPSHPKWGPTHFDLPTNTHSHYLQENVNLKAHKHIPGHHDQQNSKPGKSRRPISDSKTGTFNDNNKRQLLCGPPP